MADPGFITVVIVSYAGIKTRYAYQNSQTANESVYEFLKSQSKNVDELLESISHKQMCRFKINNKLCKLTVMKINTYPTKIEV